MITRYLSFQFSSFGPTVNFTRTKIRILRISDSGSRQMPGNIQIHSFDLKKEIQIQAEKKNAMLKLFFCPLTQINGISLN